MSEKISALHEISTLDAEVARQAARVAELISMLQKELADLRKIVRAGNSPLPANPAH